MTSTITGRECRLDCAECEDSGICTRGAIRRGRTRGVSLAWLQEVVAQHDAKVATIRAVLEDIADGDPDGPQRAKDLLAILDEDAAPGADDEIQI
jgi:hypothetical protein